MRICMNSLMVCAISYSKDAFFVTRKLYHVYYLAIRCTRIYYYHINVLNVHFFAGNS